MTRMPSTRGSKLSDNQICPHCSTRLPSQAIFCSSCGKQIKQKKNRELESDTEERVEAQDHGAQTIRLAGLPQLYVKRWLSYQSQKNKKDAGPLQESRPSLVSGEEVPAKSTSSTQELESTDEIVLLVAPIQIERTQISPIMPAPSTAETQKQTSVRANLLWPTIIILSALAAGLVNFVFPHMALRPVIVFCFLFVCPGMAVVRFFRLKEPVIEWTLAIVLSVALEAVVAAIQVNSGRWNPAATLALLINFCILVSAIQLVRMIPLMSINVYAIVKAIKRRTEKSVPLPEDHAAIEPPVLKVTEFNSSTQFAQGSLADENGQTEHDSL